MSTPTKTPPPAGGSPAALSPAIIAGVTFVAGLGLGWLGGATTGGSSAKDGTTAASGVNGATGSGSHSQMNSGAATGEVAEGKAGAGEAPKQVGVESKVFTAEA